MKKFISFLPLLAAVLAIGTMFTSCGDDPEPEPDPEPSIVGTWKQPYNDTESILTLNADGTFNFYVYGSALTGSGRYTYDKVTRTLALFYTSAGNWGDRSYIVLSLTDNYMVLMDQNGDRSNWSKSTTPVIQPEPNPDPTQHTPTTLEKSLFNTSWILVKTETYSDGQLKSTLYNDGNYSAIKLSDEYDDPFYKMYYNGVYTGVWREDKDEGNNYLAIPPIYSQEIGKWTKYMGSGGFVTKLTSSELVLSTKGKKVHVGIYYDSNAYYSIYYYSASR